MTNQVTVASDFSVQLSEFDKIYETCKKILQTKHYAGLGEAGVHAIMARAKALGIHPFEALNGGFFCINGKVGMSTEMMAALVRQKGHSIQKDPKSNNELCILHGKRADNGDTWTCTFSKEDAIAAGLWNGPTWKKYSSVMLYNRCMSMLFRQLFPDLSLGAGYVEDEIKEITKTGDYSANLQMAEAEEVKQPEPKPPTYEKISDEQFVLLNDIIGDDTDYREKINGHIKTMGLKGLQDIPVKLYDKFLESAKKNAESKAQTILVEAQVEE